MNSRYFDTLLDDSKALVKAIEKHIGKEILVKIDESRVDKLACDVENFEPKILIPKEGYFPDSSVIHELLHLERFCVKEIPLLCLCDDYYNQKFERDLTSLDDNLEHLIIVPEEIQLRPKRLNYWVDKINLKLNAYDSMIDNGQKPGLDLLVYWVFISRTFKDTELYAKIEDMLLNSNMVKMADDFQSEIETNIYCKRDLVNVCVTFAGIQQNIICLEYCDYNKMNSRVETLV